MCSLTIITPAYNRAEYIPKLFTSLCAQTNQSFQWLIIDDGSDDNTSEIIKGFSTHSFKLDYYKKKNGGKHTALNYAQPYIMGELVCIVDSDDWLLPDAVETILRTKEEYESYSNVKLFTFLRGKNESDPINTSFPNAPVISNHIDFRINANRAGDCFEVLYSDVLKEFPFPEHKNEKFLGEGYLWNNAGFKYDTVYIPKILYICEYLEGGLTKSGRLLRLKCPLGGMDNSNSFFGSKNGRKVNNKTLRKEAWLFVCYGRFAGLNRREIIERTSDRALIKRNYLFGVALYYYWKTRWRIK